MFRAPRGLVTARGWWIVGLAESPPRLIVAPLGRYSPAHARDLGGSLACLLGLDRDLRAPGAAEALAGWGWVEVDGRPAWAAPAPDAPRALLVGRWSPAFVGRNGPRPFEDAGGEQLARALAVSELSALLGTFETAYHDQLPPGRLRGRHVVALDLDAAIDEDAESAASIVVLDRTMSHNTASAALLRAAIAARRGPGELTYVEAEILALANASNGDGGHIAPSLRRAWELAERVGLAWPGSAPGAGWRARVNTCPRELECDYSGVLAEVVGGTVWRASATGPAGREVQDCVDLESALLVAERLARDLGGMTPWEQRDVGLAAAWCEAQAEGGP